MHSTHEVFNQVPPSTDYDVAEYAPILDAVKRYGAQNALDEIHEVGRKAGGDEAQIWGDLAKAER